MDSVTYRDSARLKLMNMSITKTELLSPIILVFISELSIHLAPFTHDANHKLYPGKLLLEVCRRKKLWSNSKNPVNLFN